MKERRYILGLDLGIASVGWAVVEVAEAEIEDEHGKKEKREVPIGLLDCGVRAFDRAEEPKTGESLAAGRRQARSVRRLIRRRAYRLRAMRYFMQQMGMLPATEFDEQGFIRNLPIHAWQLRVEALERALLPKEWAAVLLHLIKHRGYLSQRKSEENTSDKELGRLLKGVALNHQALQEEKFATPADLALRSFLPKSGHMRNKGGDYSHTFNRLDVQKELHLLFAKQRELGNPWAREEVEEKADYLLMAQRPALQGTAILKMLGRCTFEPEEYRAAKATYTAERFICLGKLNNLRILHLGSERALSEDERQKLLDEPYQKAKLTYKQVRGLLNLPDEARFKGLYYKLGEDVAKVEAKTFIELKAYHEIRKALEKAGLKAEWQALKNNPPLLDAIGTAFSLYKTDEDIRQQLQGLLAEEVLQVLLTTLSFDDFVALSLKALHQINPLMEKGARYDEACKEIYGNHYGNKKEEQQRLLPLIPADELRNPVVLRSLSQARKVINAVIRRYGSPLRVHIETGRELGKPFDERMKIKKRQEENQKERARAAERFKELFPGFVGLPKGLDILKLRLYEQQHGKCLYTGESIDLHRLGEKGYVEVDHVLPFSRTWDDGFNNKALVLGRANQNKGNKTPYEWLGGAEESAQWREYVARVRGCNFSYGKKQKLLSKSIEKGFIERNLNDTRYVARFLCNFIEENLLLLGKGKKRVFASNGQITSLLRGRWGLQKVREENDRHHALDAIVVACTTVGMQQKITNFVRKKEMNPFSGEMVNKTTGEISHIHFPEPWPFFRQEVMIRVFSDDPKADLEQKLPDRPEAVHEDVGPLFVSRAPTRKVTGQGHLETIKSAKRLDEGVSVQRIALSSFKLKHIEQLVGYPHREPALYEALRARLEQFKDDPAKAFATPFYKPNKDGLPSGAPIRALRIENVQKSGVMVREGNGIADNATMVRIDVFHKQGKNFIVPVYAWQVEKGILPNLATVSGKDEKDWEKIDESYEFLFSLYPNDLLEIRSDKKIIFGYYAGFDRFTSAINIKVHDLDRKQGKDGIYRGIGVKNKITLTKYQIDVLGKTINPCKKENRLGFTMKKK